MLVTPWMYQNLLDQIEKEKVNLRKTSEERAKGVNCFKSDNYDPGYHQDTQKMAMIQSRINNLEDLRYRLEIVDIENQKEVLKIGNKATIIYNDNDDDRADIVLEGNYISDGTVPYSESFMPISLNSPVGSAILNARVGERRIAPIGGRNVAVVIKEIFPPEI